MNDNKQMSISPFFSGQKNFNNEVNNTSITCKEVIKPASSLDALLSCYTTLNDEFSSTLKILDEITVKLTGTSIYSKDGAINAPTETTIDVFHSNNNRLSTLNAYLREGVSILDSHIGR